MTDEREFAEYIAQIRSEVIGKTNSEGGFFEEDAFTAVALDYLEDEEGLEEPAVCGFSDGRARGSSKINGYAIATSREDVTLFITLYFPDETPGIASSELKKNFERLRRVFEQTMSGQYRDRDRGHEDS